MTPPLVMKTGSFSAPPAVGVRRGTVPINRQQGPLSAERLLPREIFLPGPLVRVEDDLARSAVHDELVALPDKLQRLGHAEDGGQLQGAGQNGGVTGPAAGLGENGGHILLFQPRSHGRGQIPGHQDAPRGQLGQVRIRRAQEDGQQAAAHIADVRGPQAHQLVLHGGKHIGVHGTHAVRRRLGAGAAIHGLLHLGAHDRVRQHGGLAGKDLRFLLARPLPDLGGHDGGAALKLCDGFLKARFFRFPAGAAHVGIVQAHFPHAGGPAQSHAVRRGDPLQDHGSFPSFLHLGGR